MDSIRREARIRQPTFVAGLATTVVGVPVAFFDRPDNVFSGHISDVASALAAFASQHAYNADADRWWMYSMMEGGRPEAFWVVQGWAV
jgi:hypothetical protein